MYQLQYVPLALPFFLFFVGLFVFLVILIQLHVLQFAYAKLGLSSGAALLVLLASLIGSYFNIPIAEFPEREVRSGQVIEFFGMRYIVPLVTDDAGGPYRAVLERTPAQVDHRKSGCDKDQLPALDSHIEGK